MNTDELIIYSIRNSYAIKEEKKEQLIDYFCQIQQENKKYKEVINKLNNYVYNGYLINTKDIKDILKGVEDK